MVVLSESEIIAQKNIHALKVAGERRDADITKMQERIPLLERQIVQLTQQNADLKTRVAVLESKQRL